MPGRPTREFWDTVYPGIFEQYRNQMSKKDADEVARKTTATIWKNLSHSKKAKFEKLRKIREGKRENPEITGWPARCYICHGTMDIVGCEFMVSDKGLAHVECVSKDEEEYNMVSCGVCHKPIKITRDKHYFDDKTKKRYHINCIVDVCPECDRPIKTDQKYKMVKKQAYHDACVPEKYLFSRKNGIKTIDKVSYDAMKEARKAANVLKKDWREFEEQYFEQFPPTFVEDAEENPIGLASMEDFLRWWSQGLSLGLIKWDGTVLKGPGFERFGDWFAHGITWGIVSIRPGLKIESGENIIDYIARSFTLGLVTTGGSPTVLQKEADAMAKKGIIPKMKMPQLPKLPPMKLPALGKMPKLGTRTNPSEQWIDEDELMENPLPLIPIAMMAAPYAMDAVEKVMKAPAPAPESIAKPPQAPAPSKNPRGVHYILVSETGKVFANRYGNKDQAEREAHDIYERSGITAHVVYPDEDKKNGVKRVRSVIREL